VALAVCLKVLASGPLALLLTSKVQALALRVETFACLNVKVLALTTYLIMIMMIMMIKDHYCFFTAKDNKNSKPNIFHKHFA